jgi:hypothetical protein
MGNEPAFLQGRSVTRWVCPECGREFGKANQGHVCAPGVPLEEVFMGRPPVQREVYDALLAHLETLGGVHADQVRVGVFWKTDRKLAEIRPMARALSVNLALPREIRSPRVMRVLRSSSDKFWHIVRITRPDEVDDELLGWLTEAYDYATD